MENIDLEVLLGNNEVCKGLSTELMNGKFHVRMCYGCQNYLKKQDCYYNQPYIKYIKKIKEKLKKERLEKELQKARSIAYE